MVTFFPGVYGNSAQQRLELSRWIAISITSSAQVGAPQKKGPMCEQLFVDSNMWRRLSSCSLYSSVDGMRPCPTPWFSVTGRLRRSPTRILTCVLLIRSASSDHAEFPLVVRKRFPRTESCQTQSKAFDTSIVATYVSFFSSLLLARTSVHTNAARPGDRPDVNPNWRAC